MKFFTSVASWICGGIYQVQFHHMDELGGCMKTMSNANNGLAKDVVIVVLDTKAGFAVSNVCRMLKKD